MTKTTRSDKLICSKNRPSIYKKRPTGLDSYTCDMNLNIVARKVEIVKASNGGVAPYGAIRDIVNELKPTLPWLNKEMIRTYMKKIRKGEVRNRPLEPGTTLPPAEATSVQQDGSNNSSTLSTLTAEEAAFLERVQCCNNNPATATTRAGTTSMGGRPSGSTVNNKRELNAGVRLATAEAARAYKDTMDKNIEEGRSRLAKGELDSIIMKAKTKYNVHPANSICKSTIQSRYKRNNLDPATSQGTPTPMAAIEPYLVEVILQVARMRRPINATAGLHLANSMIKGTKIEQQLTKWKLKHVVQTRQ
jgi:hypothetical protein